MLLEAASIFLLGRHRESFLLFEEICGRKAEKECQLQAGGKAEGCPTCDLHLSGASVLLAAGGDGLRLDGLGVVVVDLRQLYLLHCVVVAELRQLAFEVAVACAGAEAFDVIDSVHFGHFVAGHGLPIEILAQL